MITASLIILAVLSYLGRSLVMLASVFGMALALWLARKRPLWTQAAYLVIGSLTAAIAAEVVHVAYHAYAAAAGYGDPPHGGFFLSAVLVGLINCLAMGPALGVTALRNRRRPPPRDPEDGHLAGVSRRPGTRSTP